MGHFVPRLSGLTRQYNRLRAFAWNGYLWRKNITFSPRAFDLRTRVVERYLSAFDQSYDVIFQMLTLFAPGTEYQHRRYVIYTDNTFELSCRCWPEWAMSKNKRTLNEMIQREADLFRHAACLFPCGQHAARSMIEDYGSAPEKVVAVGMSSNLPAADAATVATRRYDRQLALFAGYEFERKGGHVVLDAWPAVHQQLPAAELLIVGHERPKSGSPPGVRWLGQISGAQLLDLYDEVTVFVMPSYFEPWGSVFNEAMSHGLPCIGAETCAMPEMITDGTNGALIPVGDSVALADKLIAILGDAAYAARLGQNAYQTFNAEHTWAKIAARIKPHLERIAQ